MFKKMNEIRKSEEGFSMVEMIAVPMVFIMANLFLFNTTINLKETLEVTESINIANGAIIEYKANNNGELPTSINETNYKKYNAEVEITTITKGGVICVIGWHKEGVKYTKDNPRVEANGEFVPYCPIQY